MALKKRPTKVFDPVEFGKLVREDRKRAGFTSTPKFSAAIKEKTGVYIDPDTLHKIERGEREPDVTKLIAISATMYEKHSLGWLTGLSFLLNRSQPVEFAFSEAKYTLQREYIEKYKNKFGSLPSYALVSDSCEPSLSDESIQGSKEEKLFSVTFRNDSETFKKLREEYIYTDQMMQRTFKKVVPYSWAF